MMSIDSLIDVCAAIGELESGRVSVDHFHQNHDVPLSVCGKGLTDLGGNKGNSNLSWSEEEEDFLQENIGKLSLAEMAKALGRSENAIKIMQVRKQFPSASKRPGYLTGQQVSKLFRVDIHTVMKWHARKILEFDILPNKRKIRSVSIRRIYRWAVQPKNWIYFKVERLRDPHLKKLVLLAQERWGDEWWTIGQAARYHGVDTRHVNMHLHKGKIAGVQWGNWYLKKSDVISHTFYTGKGAYKKSQEAHQNYSPGADAWILRARDELGMQFKDIAACMKSDWNEARVFYRYQKLKEVNDG